ncbi:MAG: hypothetical protein HYW07_10720, partial [Candidatus Latescibacteria bacterium]|nr:hypothetical protein [Candidatus Latescibacterota bacterium]
AGPALRRLRQLGGVGLVLLLALALAGESLGEALQRCAHPLTAFARPARTRIALEPGDAEVVKGADLALRLRFEGLRPPSARLKWREAEAPSWQEEELALDADSLRYLFKQVQRPFAYQVEAGDGRTPVHQVRVITPPVVQRLRLEYHYPAYSGLPLRSDEENGDISGLAGTQVALELEASQALATAELVRDDTLRQAMQVEGSRARTGLAIEREGHYHLELRDLKGIASRDPIRYAIQVLRDAPPSVALAEPGRDLDLPENMQVGLKVEAADDFGVARLSLVWRLNAKAEERRGLSFRAGRQVSLAQIWDLKTFDLLPEDRVFYHVEVFDNDAISGPKMSATPEYSLRYPSLQELYEEVSQTQEQHQDSLEVWAQEEEETQRYLEQVRREALRNQEMSWEKKKELESALAAEEARARAVEELARQLEETAEKLEQSGLASQEILAKMEEIRQLMAEVASPELQQALAQLQQAMQSATPEDLAQALKEFNEDHRAFQQRLDRTLALLRQIQAEQHLEGAVKRAEDLEKRQEQINQAVSRQERELASQEGRLQQDTEELKGDLEKLGEEMRAFDQEIAQRLQAQARAMQEQQLAPRMQEMTHQLNAQQLEEARRQGESLAGDLKTLSASMRQLQGDFSSRQKKQIGRQLQQAMGELLHLSERQEALGGLGGSPAELAQDQFALLQGAGLVAERLAQAGKRTLSLAPGLSTTLGYALRSMQQAAQLLGQQEAQLAGGPQAEAMRYLNETALLLRQSMDNLAKSQMPSSFGEAMQQLLGLSEQQAGLNQATQQALGEGLQPGRRGRGRDPRQEVSRLAAEQDRISQALELLERQLRGQGGAHRRVESIGEEAKAVAEDLRSHRLSPQIMEAQQRLLHRMLDASRSIHTQGFEEKRRAESGQDQAYGGPGALPADLGQAYDQLRAAMKRALEGDYPEEYRALIEQYYEQVYQDLQGQKGQP